MNTERGLGFRHYNTLRKTDVPFSEPQVCIEQKISTTAPSVADLESASCLTSPALDSHHVCVHGKERVPRDAASSEEDGPSDVNTADTLNSNALQNTRALQDVSTASPSKLSQESLRALRRNKTEMSCVIESVMKVSALKSLVVLLSPSKLLEALSSEDSCESSFEREEERSAMQDALQSLLKSMVWCAVMPSPLKKVVTLSDLERAQSVLMKTALLGVCEKKTCPDETGRVEGKLVLAL